MSIIVFKEAALSSYPDQDEFNPNFPRCLRKIHSNIIVPSTPRSSKWFFHFRFSSNAYCIQLRNVFKKL